MKEICKFSLEFNSSFSSFVKYFSQFLIKFKAQRHICHLLIMRIPKLSLILEIDGELTEIFKVKGKAQLPKIRQTFFNDYTFLPSGPNHLQANTILFNSLLLQYI